MCRFVAWSGAPRYLEEFVFEPEQSIVAQSKKALVSKTQINADGFGLAWYQHIENLVSIKALILLGQIQTLRN